MTDNGVLTALDRQRAECCQLFLGVGAYWRSVVIGIVAVIGLACGVFAWGLHVDKALTRSETEISHNREALNRLEGRIENKLDILLKNQPKGGQ